MNPLVSIIIPTYKRAPFLRYALSALRRQTYRNFEVLLVVKRGGDDTERVVQDFSKLLPIKVLFQTEGFVSKAYNMALKQARGEIVAFLDDDSVPLPNWLQSYVELYKKYDSLGGVSGAAESVDIDENGEFVKVPEGGSSSERWKEYYFSPWSYNRPISGMSNWLIFFGRDGLVHQHPIILDKNFKKTLPSLLLMGANMSVRKKAIEGLIIEENLVLGFCYEQLLGYQIWKRGYKLFHNPTIQVLHIAHSESLGRFFRTPARAAHREAEYLLSFFFLKSSEHEISWVPFILEFFTLLVSRGLSARHYGLKISISRIYGVVYGLVVGCAFNISKAFKGKFSISNSLGKFLK